MSTILDAGKPNGKHKRERVLTRPGELDTTPVMNVMNRNKSRPQVQIAGGAGSDTKPPRHKRDVAAVNNLMNQRRMERLEGASVNMKKRPTQFVNKRAINDNLDMVLPSMVDGIEPTIILDGAIDGAIAVSESFSPTVDPVEVVEQQSTTASVPAIAEKDTDVDEPSNSPKTEDEIEERMSSESESVDRNIDVSLVYPDVPMDGIVKTIDDVDRIPRILIEDIDLEAVPAPMRDMVQRRQDDSNKVIFQPIQFLHSLYERDMLSTEEREFLAMVVDVERILGRLQDEWLRRRESWNGLGFVPFRETQLDSSTAYPQSVLAADIWMNDQLRENINMDIFHSLPRYRPISIAQERNFQFLVMKSTIEVLRTLLVDLRKHLITSMLNMEFIISEEGSYNLNIVFMHTAANDMLLGPDGLAYLSVIENGDNAKRYWMIRSQTQNEKGISKEYYEDYYDDCTNWFVIQDWVKDWLCKHPEILTTPKPSLKVLSTWKDIQKSTYYQSVTAVKSPSIRSKVKRKITRSSKSMVTK